MSLIADALRKTNPVSPQTPAPSSPRKPGWLGGLVLLGTAGIAASLISHSKHSLPPANSRTPSAPSKAVSTPRSNGLNLLRMAEGQWRLNGVIQGGKGESLALINGQVVEEGATIQGAKVVRVAQDQVDIDEGDGQIKTLKIR